MTPHLWSYSFVAAGLATGALLQLTRLVEAAAATLLNVALTLFSAVMNCG